MQTLGKVRRDTITKDLLRASVSMILRLVRRPYGLHAILAFIQIHASHKTCGPITITTSSSATASGWKQPCG